MVFVILSSFNTPAAMKLFLFSTFWILLVFLVNILIARKLPKVDTPKLSIYVLTMAALGLFGEVMFDLIYSHIFGKPLWEYRFTPIHQGFTSVYSLFLWGAIGMHLYLIHQTLEDRGITSKHILAAIFCLEAIVLEALMNLSFLAVFGHYVYYYLPADLWHITSVQTLPLYLLAGYITVFAMEQADRLRAWAYAGNTVVLVVLLAV